jgi:O-antigen ligase
VPIHLTGWGLAALSALSLGLAITRGTETALLLFILLLIGAVAVAFAFVHPRWALVAALFLLVTYTPDVLVPGDAASLVSHALIGLLLAVIVVRRALRVDTKLQIPIEMIPLVIFVLAMAASTAFATDPRAATAEVLDVLGLGSITLLLIVLLDRPHWLRRAMWAVALGMAGLAILSIVQQLTKSYSFDFLGFSRVESQDDYFRSAGPLSPNYLALVMTVASIYSFYLWKVSRRTSTRGIAVIASVACFAGIAFTFSRGSLLALIVTGLSLVLLRRIRPMALVTASGVLIVASLLFWPGDFKDRLSATAAAAFGGPEAVEDTSIRGRTSEALAALEMWVNHPLLGVGPDNYPIHYQEYSSKIGLDPRAAERHPHNLYLETLAETGLLGASAFFLILWMAGTGAWRRSRRLGGEGKLLTEGIFVALLAFMTNSLTLHASYARYLWIFVGLGLAARRIQEEVPTRAVGDADA